LKIKIEPSKFEHILRVALISDTKSLLEKCPVEFKKSGLAIKDRSYNSVITVGVFNKSYFKEYDSSNEKIVLTKSLLDKMKLFKGEEEITITTDNDINKIHVASKKVSYEEELLQPSEEDDFGIEMEKTELGVIPKKVVEEGYDVAFDVKTEHLNGLPDSEIITFNIREQHGDSVECEIVDRGITRISFPVEKFHKLSDFQASFNGSVLSKIVSNLSDIVSVAITDTGLIFNQKNPDFVVMYGQAAQSQKRTVEVETEETTVS